MSNTHQAGKCGDCFWFFVEGSNKEGYCSEFNMTVNINRGDISNSSAATENYGCFESKDCESEDQTVCNKLA